MTKYTSRYKSRTKKNSKSRNNKKNSKSRNNENNENNEIIHNSITNILDNKKIDEIGINDDNFYKYIFENEEEDKDEDKDKNANKHKNANKNAFKEPKKIKKDYTSILNNNYLMVKEERKYAFKQGKGYGASTIKEEVEACISLLNIAKPKIFIDIGACIGNYTKEVLKKYPNINAFLFEPQSATQSFLQAAFSHLKNVHINDCALSNKNGRHKIYFNNPGTVLACLTKRRLQHFNIDMSKSEEIITKRFDDYWKTTEFGKSDDKSNDTIIIDYVKIDVEGHELDVLEGFGSIIDNVRIIQFEFGGANIDTRTFFQDFWYFFTNKNYSLYRITPIGVLPIRKYTELDEFFSTTNYIAVNNKFSNIEVIDNYKPNVPNVPNVPKPKNKLPAKQYNRSKKQNNKNTKKKYQKKKVNQ